MSSWNTPNLGSWFSSIRTPWSGTDLISWFIRTVGATWDSLTANWDDSNATWDDVGSSDWKTRNDDSWFTKI